MSIKDVRKKLNPPVRTGSIPPPTPCPCGHHKIWKIRIFFTKKCRRPHLKTPHTLVGTGPPDCGRILWTAPNGRKQLQFLFLLIHCFLDNIYLCKQIMIFTKDFIVCLFQYFTSLHECKKSAKFCNAFLQPS